MNTDSAIPLACVAGAIPEHERPAHFELLGRLFSMEVRERRKHSDGYAFRFPASAWNELARWIGNERLCCPFLHFTVDVSPDAGDIWVRLRGPDGVHAFLDAEFPLMHEEGDR